MYSLSVLEGYVMLVDHPDRATILPWVRGDVSAYEFIVPHARGVSVERT